MTIDADHPVIAPGENVPKVTSCRWLFCYISCIAMMCVYAVRVDISVAIVCMVNDKHGNHSTGSSESEQECVDTSTSHGESKKLEFDWPPALVASILGGFFYGYTVSNIPGGILADKYGGKKVFFGCLFTAGCMTILHPVLSRVSPYLTLAARVMTGFVSGPLFPSMHSLWGRWAPPIERTKLMSICYAGPYMGNIITLILSGYLCANGFDNGWGSIFYVFGGATIIFCVVWWFTVFDTPNSHPRITAAERDFLNEAVESHSKVSHVPWVKIFSARSMWAIIVAHFCYNWCNYTLLTVLPLFMKEVLKFNIKTNGLMSSIPYLGQFLGYTAIGPVADYIDNRQLMSTRNMRVTIQTVSFLGTAAFLVGTSFIKCTNAMSAVGLLFFAAAFMGFSGGGFFVNHVDIAPSYAGVLFGITNCISALSGFLAPLLAKGLTPDGTQEQWQNVFYVCSGFCVFGVIIFGLCAKGTVETWAVVEDRPIELEKRKSTFMRKYTSEEEVKLQEHKED
ncbi:sialin-like [Argonauta hians]